jgi:hypothetical protein
VAGVAQCSAVRFAIGTFRGYGMVALRDVYRVCFGEQLLVGVGETAPA